MKLLALDRDGVLPILDDTHIYIAHIMSRTSDHQNYGYWHVAPGNKHGRYCMLHFICNMNPFSVNGDTLAIGEADGVFQSYHINIKNARWRVLRPALKKPIQH